GGVGLLGLRRIVGGPLALIVGARPFAFWAMLAIPFIDTFSRPKPNMLATLIEYGRILVDLVGERRLPAIVLDLHAAFLVALPILVAGIVIPVVGFLLVLAMIPLLGPVMAVNLTMDGLAKAERDKRFTISDRVGI